MKLFAFDLDGTLLNSKEKLSKETIDGINNIRQQGHIVTLITGRSTFMTQSIYKELNLDAPYATFNGAVIQGPYDPSWSYEVLYINQKDFGAIMLDSTFMDHTNSLLIEKEKATYSDNLESDFAKLNQKWTKQEVLPMTKDVSVDNVIACLAELSTDDEAVAIELVNKLNRDYQKLEVSYWYFSHIKKFIIEISSKGSRKDFALKKIANHYNIDIKDTYAFGDSNNDYHMLINAGKGIAMKNGLVSIKKIADDITKFDNDDNGAIRYIFENILKGDEDE